MQFRVLVGDITKWPAAGIVNSASSTLLDVSAQDHKLYGAAGLSLAAACRSLQGCLEGEAKITKGYKLPAKYIIHAVGPYWVGGKRGEEQMLASAYTHSLQIAAEHHIDHLAFTSLSTEDKRYPRQRAAAVAVPIILEQGTELARIDMVCTDGNMQQAYTKAAVFWWLKQIQDAAPGEQKSRVEEAAAALVMLPLSEDTPDPLVLANALRQMATILAGFVQKGSKRTLVDMEQTAAAIMATYQTPHTTAPATALDAAIKAYQDSKKVAQGDRHE